VANVRQVDANLVRATGFEGETQEAQGTPGFEHLVVRAGGPPSTRHHGHFLALLGMPSDGRIDGALQRWQAPTHERDIAPLQLAGLELRGEMALTAVVLGDQQETGRIFVEPVHDAWTFFTPNARQCLAMKQQRIDQGTAGMPRRRMDHQPWRFIDDEQGFVFIDNL
jgi:hypothetical protein